jgi:hypothetical protein
LTVYSLAKSEKKGILEILQAQFALCFFIGAALGQVSIIGFFLNMIVVPLFPFVTVWMIPLLTNELFPESFIYVGNLVQTLFLDAMKWLSQELENWPLLYFEISHQTTLRLGFFSIAMVCLFFLMRKTRSRNS